MENKYVLLQSTCLMSGRVYSVNWAVFLQYKEMYEKSVTDPEGFWGQIAEEFTWKDKVGIFSGMQYLY